MVLAETRRRLFPSDKPTSKTYDELLYMMSESGIMAVAEQVMPILEKFEADLKRDRTSAFAKAAVSTIRLIDSEQAKAYLDGKG